MMLRMGTEEAASSSLNQWCAVLQGMAIAKAPAPDRTASPSRNLGSGDTPWPRIGATRSGICGQDQTTVGT